MHSFPRNRMPSPAPVRRRLTSLGAGLGASLLLATTFAIAAEPVGPPNEAGTELAAAQGAVPLRGDALADQGLTGAVLHQADAQHTVALAEHARKQAAAEAARLHAAALKAVAERRAAAERASRAAEAERARKLQQSWVSPVARSHLGASYGRAGSRWARRHSGQDFIVPTGTAVRAVHGGTVVEAGWGGAYGWNVVIRHAPGVYTQYAHLSRLGVRTGQRVGTSAVIGRSGSTGNSTGPHLHFEVRTAPWYGSSIAPLPFLRSKGVRL
ncbi:M23 family metallopeptidase [Streptomyces sp. NPDC056632]|uniref:M23 family metallopeptidase n=1 Tax=Streptomyces sp. NPDC056632 TaxID=3345884 RepID=UPI0036C13D77